MGIREDIIAALAKFENALAATLETDVADALKSEMQDVLDEEVYSYKADPFFLGTRRGDDGGLRDKENMWTRVEDNDTLILENEARTQSLWEDITRRLTPFIEQGLPNYRAGGIPFHSMTEKRFVASGRAEQAIKSGLKKRGY